MTWTYAPSLPTNTDHVRFGLGDTDITDQLLSDEEIAALLAAEGTVALATIRAADMLTLLFGRKAQELTDDLGQRIKYGDRAAMFRTLAATVRGSSATIADASSSSVQATVVW
ncbi:MAG: hypothetical protein M3R61_21545 [Chloroflexota bacterium]|nr:hypothetical protein [Chloroflexota bacterium]